MSFLDNSGDIILDAVLTDAGRERLARGDGSFKITKFALGDDEINYENYDGTDPRGSAFYDLEILQTPVLEAFTNNTSNLKSKLITITRTNILYLPIMLINEEGGSAGGIPLTDAGTSVGGNIIPVAVDSATMVGPTVSSGGGNPRLNAAVGGNAYNAATSDSNPIVIDQGLNTAAISPETNIPADLYESQYQIQMDNRLISLATSDGTTVATPSFVDDDSIASYSVSSDTYVSDIVATDVSGSPIAGPRGSRLQFGLRSSLDVQSSTYLFTTLGSEVSDGTNTYYYIDTTVRVTGLTTGNSVDLPVRLFKYKSTP
tara:strand:+ start:2189 stop:3136 length:948 start_codon:yes stop_codon:yes gene_type:complete